MKTKDRRPRLYIILPSRSPTIMSPSIRGKILTGGRHSSQGSSSRRILLLLIIIPMLNISISNQCNGEMGRNIIIRTRVNSITLIAPTSQQERSSTSWRTNTVVYNRIFATNKPTSMT